MTQQPLDPRKSPWKRGDVCTRGFDAVGFVLNYTPEYLEILWNKSGIERVPADGIDNVLRVAHSDDVSPSGDRTNLETLNALQGLEAMQIAIENRTFKNDREKGQAEKLLRRSFKTD